MAARCCSFVQARFDIGHAGEHFGRAVDAVVDEVIEADVIVARQPHRTRDSATPTDVPGEWHRRR